MDRYSFSRLFTNDYYLCYARQPNGIVEKSHHLKKSGELRPAFFSAFLQCNNGIMINPSKATGYIILCKFFSTKKGRPRGNQTNYQVQHSACASDLTFEIKTVMLQKMMVY